MVDARYGVMRGHRVHEDFFVRIVTSLREAMRTFAPMRAIIAALVVLSMLFGQTELHQLARLPHLVRHYLDHQAEEPGTTVVGFLVMHYFSGNVHDEDFEQDERLPFRSHDDHINFNVAQDLFHAPLTSIAFHYPSLPLDPVHPEAALSLGERTDVWQPPKRA